MKSEVSKFGTLWGISVGPGQPNWLTEAARDRLQRTTIIACPQDRHGQPGMAYRIIESWATQPRESIPQVLALKMPFVQDRQVLEQAWEEAAQQVIEPLSTGKDVVFVSEGDVSFYSTFTYLATVVHRLEGEIAIEAIPGVCSPLAAAAALKMPLSIWDEAVVILPAMHRLGELEKILDWADVVVLMKVAPVFRQVWGILQQRGLLDKTGLVEWVGWPEQQVHQSLEDLGDYEPPYFAIAIVRQQEQGSFA